MSLKLGAVVDKAIRTQGPIMPSQGKNLFEANLRDIFTLLLEVNRLSFDT